MGWLGRRWTSNGRRTRGWTRFTLAIGVFLAPLVARRAVTTSFADASDLTLSLPVAAGSNSLKDSGDELAAFVQRTVTSAYTSAAELQAATSQARGGSARYPETDLAGRFDLVARSIKAGSPARVYYLIQSGYDSHAVQLPTHSRLLGELSGALRAFLDDLASAKLAERVIVMAFSEFGRRPEENGSLGTDHGTAAPVFVAGTSVEGGLKGRTPLLGDLVDGDLRWSTDFRSIYATLLDHWLELPSEEALGGRFDTMPLIHA